MTDAPVDLAIDPAPRDVPPIKDAIRDPSDGPRLDPAGLPIITAATWKPPRSRIAHRFPILFPAAVEYHRMRRPGETIEHMVVREKKREDLIRRLTGWTVIRLTWADLRTPAYVARVIRSAFAVPAAPAV